MGIIQQYWDALKKAKIKKKKDKEEGTKRKEGKNPYSFFDLGKGLKERKKKYDQTLKDTEK